MCMLHSTFLFNYKLITSSALVTYIFLLLLFIIYISLLYKLSYISFFLSYSCLHYITFPYEILILLLLDSFFNRCSNCMSLIISNAFFQSYLCHTYLHSITPSYFFSMFHLHPMWSIIYNDCHSLHLCRTKVILAEI